MNPLKTKADYWALVEAKKAELQQLVANFHPFYRAARDAQVVERLVQGEPVKDYPITAPAAEAACEAARKVVAGRLQEDPQVRFTRYVTTKDKAIVNLLNEVWFGMPESAEVRREPGFSELCDLCSEGYLLDDPEDDEGDPEPEGPLSCGVCGAGLATMTPKGPRCNTCWDRDHAAANPVPLPNNPAMLKDLADLGVPGAAEKLQDKEDHERK